MEYANTGDTMDIHNVTHYYNYTAKGLNGIFAEAWTLYSIRDGEGNESWTDNHDEYLEVSDKGKFDYTDKNAIYHGKVTINDHCIFNMDLDTASKEKLEGISDYEALYVYKIKWDQIYKYHISGLDGLYLYASTETYHFKVGDALEILANIENLTKMN